jgi:ADP-heptose:LPS heptosyltransferase
MMKLWLERGAWVSNKARKTLATLAPTEVKRVAVIRHAALGDMVLTRPFLIEARRFFPNATLTLSTVSHYTYGTPDDLVDRVHTMYGNNQRDVKLSQQLRRARELGEQDVLFDLAITSRSLWLGIVNKARIKIGFPYRPWQQRLYFDAAVWRSDFQFEAVNMLDMLNLLGANTRFPPEFAMPGTPQARQRPCLIYFTSASTANKCWPQEHFVKLIDQCATTYPKHDHILLEGTAEWEAVTPLMQQLQQHHNVMVQKAMSLDQTIALLKAADCVISNDTGIRNLAISTDTPTVGIFFATIPFRYWPRYGRHNAVFNADGSIPSVADVYQAIANVLGSG